MSEKIVKEIAEKIEEYNSRINDCDILLHSNLSRKQTLRSEMRKGSIRPESYVEDRTNLSSDRKRVSAQRQCYVQFISDLKGFTGDM